METGRITTCRCLWVVVWCRFQVHSKIVASADIWMGHCRDLFCEMRKARHSLIHQWLRHATQTSEIAKASCSRCWQAGKDWFIPDSTRDQSCRWWGSMHFHLRECRISTPLLWFLQFKCLPAWPRQVVWWVQLWHCPEDPPSLPPSHPPGVSLGQTGAVDGLGEEPRKVSYQTYMGVDGL